ncbi:MAG: S41 family peptidase [Pirellulaceae bacterium]
MIRKRRHADTSFVRLVRSADHRQAAQIYGEVLDKIETFHVDTPDYGALFQQGRESLLVALHSDAFHEVHQVAPTEAQLALIDQLIADRARVMRVADRRSLEAAVEEMAETVSQETGLPPAAVTMEFACGATAALDWYSSFLTGDQYDEVMSQIRGDFVGLGVELRPTDEFLEILDVIESGPAGEAGLRAGDRILSIDGQTVQSLGGNPAADRLRGEENSAVRLRVETPGTPARDLTLTRRRVEIASIREAQMIDPLNGVAYVRLAAFQRTTRDEMLKHLWDLHRQGMKSLVIDLRGNPGGLLDAAVDVADLFLPAGTIVTTRGRNFEENHVHRARFEGTWRVPVVVMIDGDSASASEILAGALRDNDRATIVGERSYGKGSVQGIFALNSCPAGLRLTTSKFYSPSGHAISDGGVEPNVPVALDQNATPVSDAATTVTTLRPSFDADPILAMAIRVASGEMRPLQP